MRPHPLSVLRTIVCAAALCTLASPAFARLTLMHGFVDYASALLWIQTEHDGPVTVTWRARDGTEHRLDTEARSADERVVLARLSDLAPGTQVPYAVAGDGERREGAIRTQAYWRRPADAAPLTIAIGSCFFLGDPAPPWDEDMSYGGGYGIFDAIAGLHPDLMVWMGDNLYFQVPDELDPASMAARYRRQRSYAPLQRLLTATAHVAIWDDHDYGPNDADLSYTMKGESLALFRRYWANPSYGLPETPGVFGRVRLGDVDIFLLDDRWYRTANDMRDGPGKVMLGAAQLEWLRSALVYSHAPIKLVVNGSQLFNRANRFEGWQRFDVERQAFLRWLSDQQVDGVIFASGDRHFGELLRVAREGTYPLYEFTSSPLTSRPFDIQDPAERGNPDIVAGTFAASRQFGVIRVSGPSDARRITFESHDAGGALLWRHDIEARDLRHRN